MSASKNHLLKLVEDKSQFASLPRRTIGELWEENQRAMHALHYVAGYHGSFRPELVSHCLQRYSDKGAVVFDPFCGRGTTALEANLSGRIAYSSDLNPVAVLMTSAKTLPVGLDEVVLRLNEVDFNRPVDLTDYQNALFPFYHPDTYRELVNLRQLLRKKRDRVNQFISLLALSRLHGHTAAYFSTYSAPQRALSPERQHILNLQRREQPPYRAVAPRLIRRAAEALQDGFGQGFFELASKNTVRVADARRTEWLAADSVDMIVSGLPLPDGFSYHESQWLEYWFADVSAANDEPLCVSDLALWRDFVSDSLRGMLRTLKPGAYAALSVGELQTEKQLIFLEDVLGEEAQRIEAAGKRFRVEEVLIHQQRVSERASRSTQSGSKGVVSNNNRILVLKAVSKSLRPRVR
ncbi:MAG: DNA methyltransferase [Bdellovibrionota bacterium]